MLAKEYIAAISREVEEWPGAEVNFAMSARHQIAELAFAGRRQRHYFPSTPSDVRGLQNCLSDVRRTLKNLGAWRAKAAASPHRKRTRNKPERGLPVSLEPAPVMPSPFEVLAKLKEELPMTRTIEIAGKTVTLETGKAPAPRAFGRSKGPIRMLCEAMKEGESAFIPVSSEAVASANLNSIGKAIGAKFAYRQEEGGVRIYCLAASPTANVEPIKKASGWA